MAQSLLISIVPNIGSNSHTNLAYTTTLCM